MIKLFTRSLCLFLILAQTSHAQENVLLTADHCVQSALENNPSLKIAELEGVQAGAGRTKALGKMLPVLSTSFYGALSTEDPVLAFDARAMQPLFLGGELLAGKKKAEAGVGINQYKQTLSKAEIAYLARRLFFEIKKKEAEVKLAEESFIHAKKLKDASQTLVEKEAEPEAMLLERATGVSQKEKELLELRQELETLYDRLLYVSGFDRKASYVLTDVDAQSLGSGQDVPAENNFVEKILDLKINQAQQDLKIAQSNRFPKLYLVSRYRYEDESFYEKNALEAGVLVKWNIWDFGVTSSEIREQKAELSKQEWLKLEELEKHNAELAHARSALETKAKVIDIAQHDLAAVEEQFKNAKARQINGDISALAMDAMRLRHLTAQTNLTLAVCDYEITKALLFKLLGLTGVEE